MTAIIGVINKTAVALAADSASTVTGGSMSKVYNNANKIFNLSSCHPVGISIYNSAEFMGMPWETIIKMHRKELGSASFPDLFEYANNFVTYINKLKPKISSIDSTSYLTTTLTAVAINLHNEADTEATKPVTNEELNKILLKNIKDRIKELKSLDTLQEFADYTLETFLATHESFIEELIDEIYEPISSNISPLPDTLDAYKEVFYLSIIKPLFENPYSGIIITGFGEDDMFPKLRSITIGGVVDQRLRYTTAPDIVIDNQNESAIAPFAQIDIISTFLKGIDPFVISNISAGLKTILDSYNSDIEAAIPEGVDKSSIKGIINKAPEILDKFKEIINHVCNERNLYPILGTLGTLSKEDLVEMAESLINLTSLKRRVSFTEESVGGPVDVALITKGDGFVWIKRKHYFKPELNFNYLAGVLNNKN